MPPTTAEGSTAGTPDVPVASTSQLPATTATAETKKEDVEMPDSTAPTTEASKAAEAMSTLR